VQQTLSGGAGGGSGLQGANSGGSGGAATAGADTPSSSRLTRTPYDKVDYTPSQLSTLVAVLSIHLLP